MSWSALTNNQAVTYNNAEDAVSNGYFVAKHSYSSYGGLGYAFFMFLYGKRAMTKTAANDWMVIDTSHPSYASKSSNQIVVKQDLVNGNILRTLSWSFSRTGGGTGQLYIYVNGSVVVSTSTNGDSGNFNAYDTDSLDITVESDAGSAFARITFDGTQVDFHSGSGVANAAYSTTVSANHTILAEAYDGS